MVFCLFVLGDAIACYLHVVPAYSVILNVFFHSEEIAVHLLCAGAVSGVGLCA